MIPLYLYIENFQCHEKSEINFTLFESALLIGKVDNNDLIANGVGKSSIFKSIEYVLFNQVWDPLLSKSMVLEKLIRDDVDKVLVIFDFEVENNIYRIIRARTKKGISDLSLYKRGTIPFENFHTPDSHKDDKIWENISSRRTSDTESDLAKLLKINYKGFLNTVHFMQSDMTGLATLTPEKRKASLKESLNLLIWAKLEKLAKSEADSLMKQIEKNQTLFDSIISPEEKIKEAKDKINQSLHLIKMKDADIALVQNDINELNLEISSLTNKLVVLETETSALFSRKESLVKQISDCDTSLLDYSKKKKIIVDKAQNLTNSLKLDQEKKNNLELKDFSRINKLKSNIEKLLTDIGSNKSQINNLILDLEELKIPMPEDGSCKHCRQLLTPEHKLQCQLKIDEEIKTKNVLLSNIKNSLDINNKNYKISSDELKSLELDKKTYNELSSNIKIKESELSQLKSSFQELNEIVKSLTVDLKLKKEELVNIKNEVEKSSAKEIDSIKLEINKKSEDLKVKNQQLDNTNHSLAKLNAEQSVLEHMVKEFTDSLTKKQSLSESVKKLEIEYSIYPWIIKAFGSTGIPNVIIQNLLEEYQEEANKILSNIRPGLQLAFSIEKTKSDGNLDDTLDLQYYLNNKARDYSQLSGAQRLCIAFALKLGLSYLFNNKFGSKINLLMLDEIDQSLDKSSTDAFADIIKRFQKDFTVLVITHSDRMQDKFVNKILVEQDQNMVSRAKVL